MSGRLIEIFDGEKLVEKITGKSFCGIKLIWTVDAQKAKEFRENYYPHCDTRVS